MRKIPKKITKNVLKKNMNLCIHKFHKNCAGCSGRVTWEHAFCYAGKQINEEWNIVPCCEKHNIGVFGTEKEFNQFFALKNIPINYLQKKYPKFNWEQKYNYLLSKFIK